MRYCTKDEDDDTFNTHIGMIELLKKDRKRNIDHCRDEGQYVDFR